MSTPVRSDDVKLVASLFSSQEAVLPEVIEELATLFGPVEWRSPGLFFDRTRYYERELGWPLHRRFVSFRELCRPGDLVTAKLKTNALEKRYLSGDKRRVNIDPGYISLERLVLATGKNYIHRIYLGKGIYADLTLIFNKGTFQPLQWTYRDYADPEVIRYFNDLRENYRRQLRGIEE